jgi:hypothetical protein
MLLLLSPVVEKDRFVRKKSDQNQGQIFKEKVFILIDF